MDPKFQLILQRVKREGTVSDVFDYVRNKLVSAHCNVTLSILTVTEENHKRCIFSSLASICSAVLPSKRNIKILSICCSNINARRYCGDWSVFFLHGSKHGLVLRAPLRCIIKMHINRGPLCINKMFYI